MWKAIPSQIDIDDETADAHGIQFSDGISVSVSSMRAETALHQICLETEHPQNGTYEDFASDHVKLL